MEEIHALQPVLILLSAGILAVIVMRPLKASPIVGYLLVGMLIGPEGLGLIQESNTTHLLAELGVVFLLFDIGLHFSLEHIWDARREILGLGPMQVIFCTVALAGIVLLLNVDPILAFIVGAGLALSSTAVVAQVLAGRQQNCCPVGSGAMAVLIFQDISAIFLLILADSFGNEGASLFSTMGSAALKALGAFLVTVVIGRYLATPIFREIANLKNEETLTATALLIVLATAAATGLMELSLTLGAFLGGMMIAETPYRHFIQTEVKPFRGLLLSFFFITIGMSLHTQTILGDWWQILLVVGVLLIIKTVFIYLAALALHTPNQTAIQLGFLLSQGSEFAFVVFSLPHITQSLGAEISSVLISSVALSMALTPLVAQWGYQFAEKLQATARKHSSSQDAKVQVENTNVIIMGMGDIGRKVADGLEAYGIPYTAIEANHDRFTQANTDGYQVVFGDGTDLRLMETLEIAQANTLVNTEPRLEIIKQILPISQKRYPNLQRIVSVDDEEQRTQFESLKIKAVIDRSFPKGLDIAAAVLRNHYIDEKTISDWTKRQQSRALDERGELSELSSAFPGLNIFNQEG
ncbi:MAG: potassium transporter [Nitrospirales bacterium]|nr:MAG: potassium transporter [Nitrospirales bacterium]